MGKANGLSQRAQNETPSLWLSWQLIREPLHDWSVALKHQQVWRMLGGPLTPHLPWRGQLSCHCPDGGFSSGPFPSSI